MRCASRCLQAIVLLLLALALGLIGTSTDAADGRLLLKYHSALSLIDLGGSMTLPYLLAALIAVSAAVGWLYAWAFRAGR